MSAADVLAALKSEAGFVRLEGLHASATRLEAVATTVVELMAKADALLALNADEPDEELDPAWGDFRAAVARCKGEGQ